MPHSILCARRGRSGGQQALVRSVHETVSAMLRFGRDFLLAQNQLLRFEVFRIVGGTNDVTVMEAAEGACQRLFTKVTSMKDHPLRQCFLQRRTITRASMQLRPPKAKTTRFSSFIRFAR